ncbi:MAG TPA: hypothetical protein VK917_06085, partial [Ilumatobacter sp.]|nr:hypothetical protein [Ilumatobacter sp.]
AARRHLTQSLHPKDMITVNDPTTNTSTVGPARELPALRRSGRRTTTLAVVAACVVLFPPRRTGYG